MIELRHLTKRFGSRPAVQELSLQVPRGVIFGLLGHNGAGKSTLIGLLLGQILPDAGQVLINGTDVLANRAQALERVGAIYETPVFYEYLSGTQNLRLLQDYSGPSDPARTREIVEFVGLSDRIQDRVGTYSHGMRQRLALAQALLPRPDLLILDEPTDGLDPEGIHEIRQLICQLHRDWGLTILLSSHLLAEMQQICSHLAILRQGRLLFTGNWRELAAQRQRIQIRVSHGQDQAIRGLQAAGLLAAYDPRSGAELAGAATTAQLAQWLVQHQFAIEQLGPHEHTLEEFYLELTRQGERR